MTIVVGYNATDEGRAALQAAAVESESRRVPLVVVNSTSVDHRWDADDGQRLADELDEIKLRLDAVGVEHTMRGLARGDEVRGEDPAEDLMDVAADVSAALIVIGVRRRSPVGKLLLGSTAQQVLLQAECPVLAVKAP